MKKLIAILLIFVFAFAFVSCGKDEAQTEDTNNVSAEIINEIAGMFASSTPTKSVVGTTITSSDTVLVGEYTIITGQVGGKEAATYFEDQERLISIDESGSLDIVTGTVVKEAVYKEYLEGKGVRIDGGAWDETAVNFAPKHGPMSINLDRELLAKSQYDEATKTLTCTVAAANSAAFLGLAENLTVDASVEIVHDGASINRITVSFTIPSDGTNSDIKVEIKAFYTYDLEILNIVE